MTQTTTSCGTARVAVAPRSGATGHVAANPRGSSGRVPTAPRGITVTGGTGSSGISADADNLLILGSDEKPFISCLIIDECLDGRFEPLGAVEDAFTDHLAAANPHSQYLLSTAYTAADVLAKLLTVDTDNAGINATTLQGYTPSSFDAAGAATAAISAHTGLADPHSQYLFDSQVSAYGLTLIDDANAAAARTTLELGTMALETAANYLLASGATVGAASQVQTLTLGAKLPSLQPLVDGTQAIKVFKADGTTVIANWDTTNSRLGVGGIPAVTFQAQANDTSVNAITNVARLVHGISSGTVATSIGTGLVFAASNNSAGVSDLAKIESQWTFSGGTAGAESSDLIFSIKRAGTYFEGFRLDYNGDFIVRQKGVFARESSAINGNAAFSINSGTWNVGNGAQFNFAIGSPNHTGIVLRSILTSAGGSGLADLQFGIKTSTGSTAITEAMRLTSDGYLAIAQTSATGLLDIAASTTARASLRLRTGVAPTSPNAGDMWSDGVDFYGRGAASYSWGAVVRTTAIRPLTDSTTALQLQNAAGTAVVTVDTTNNRVRFKDLIGWNSIVSGDLVGLDFFRSGFFGSRLRADDANGDLRWFDTTSGTEVERARFNRTGGFSTFGGQATFQSNVMIGAVGDSIAREIIFPKLFNDAIVLRTFRKDASDYADRIALTSGTIAGSGVGIAYLRLRNTYLGAGNETPTALIDIAASDTIRASLRLRAGVAPTSPNDGDVWFDGTDLKMRIGGVTKTFTLV